MRPRSCLLLLSLTALAGCRDAPSTAPPPAASSAPPATTAATTSSARAAALELVEFTTGGADASQALPLVLALHGLGDRPESFSTWLRDLPAPARVYGLRAPLAWGPGFSWFPPTSRGGPVDADAIGPGVSEAVSLLLADLDRLVARKPTRGKPVVTGFSQGGMLSFALLARAPGRLAAAIPIGGLLPASADIAPPPPSPPLLAAFHGAADERVPVGLARVSVERFQKKGWSAELREYPGVGHSISADERRALLQAIAGALP